MTRNQAYDLGAALLAGAAAVVAGVSIAFPSLAGGAVLLAMGAGVFAFLRVRYRIRSESRHRWALQRRVGLLEESACERPAAPEEQQHVDVEPDRGAELTTDEPPAGDEGYLQLALLHDRLHALEASLRPTSRDH